MTEISDVDQSNAYAGGDIVAGHKVDGDLTQHIKNENVQNQVIHVNASAPRKTGRIEALIKKLREEIASNAEIQHTLEGLSRFERRITPDGIEGLEDKLMKGGRGGQYYYALLDKEDFAKLLMKMQRFASAQEILALTLANIEWVHRHLIEPRIGELSKVDIDRLVRSEIIEPIINDLDVTEFGMTHNMVMGMIYWLADRCYVKWH